ncbi:PEPxxWA-CTERM sorting domain-containing protein [uncultured Sphingomonas sp.]|uniref:PEPxxWA-CTERM sorting domain-containing protein n=1 Tax=uncultured Sphingomonas sp. TaxID=158754 RepID=UPI0035CC0E7F
MHRLLSSCAAMLMVCLPAQPASAAIIIESYRFSATTEGPITSFSGTTTLAIDEDDIASRVLAFDLTVGGTNFTAALVGVQTLIGGRVVVLQPLAAPSVGTDGFQLFFVRDELDGANFGYTLATSRGPNDAFGFTRVTVERIADAVPEPATWAMMIVGFALTGGALRRRRACSNLGAIVSG